MGIFLWIGGRDDGVQEVLEIYQKGFEDPDSAHLKAIYEYRTMA
jgi:hypothetical protein